MKEENLTPKDYLGLAIEAGIGAIPVIGGPVQTLYFGRQNEKRFKRIENFYASLNEDLDTITDRIGEIENFQTDRDQLFGIIESINDEIEKARTQSKLQYYKTLYINCILNINNSFWDEEEYFLEILNRITPLQIEAITFLSSHPGFQKGLNKPNVSQFLFDGSLNILVDLGVLEPSILSLTFIKGGEGRQEMAYKLSDLGIRFVDTVLRPIV